MLLLGLIQIIYLYFYCISQIVHTFEIFSTLITTQGLKQHLAKDIALCVENVKEGNYLRKYIIKLSVYCIRIRTRQGKYGQINPLLEGVPEGKAQGNSQRRWAIFDRIIRVKSYYKQYINFMNIYH